MTNDHDPETRRADLLKALEQSRDFQREQYMLATRVYLEYQHAERMKCFDGLVSYGSTTVRSAFLLNGGAILAFMTFAGGLFAKSDQGMTLAAISFAHALTPALWSFVAGISLAAMTSGIGYLNFSAAVLTYFDHHRSYAFVHAKPVEEISDKFRQTANFTVVLAVICAASSLICFLIGCVFVGQAVTILGV